MSKLIAYCKVCKKDTEFNLYEYFDRCSICDTPHEYKIYKETPATWLDKDGNMKSQETLDAEVKERIEKEK